jgi:hypothetical protein
MKLNGDHLREEGAARGGKGTREGNGVDMLEVQSALYTCMKSHNEGHYFV